MSRKWIASLVVLGTVATAGYGIRATLAENTPTTMPADAAVKPASPLDFTVKDIDGKDVNLADYRGKVVMIVNVASKCGNTPQYEGLEAMYKKYADQGFVILGFPANNFHDQEPGTNSDIKTFCTSKYQVTFPMMSKISVKGDDKAPLYKFLTEEKTAGPLKGEVDWNFAKFIVDRNGTLIGRFIAKTKPTDKKLVAMIEGALAK